MDEARQIQVAAFCYEDTDSAEQTLVQAVDMLRVSGFVVGGLLQRAGERLSNGKRRLWLEDITTGSSIRLDEFRGARSTACVLDNNALAEGAVHLKTAIDARPDLVMISRFGAVEAAGGGLRDEVAAAVLSGAMVLIPVRPALLPDLQRFLGFQPTVVSGDSKSVAAWVRSNAPVDQPR